MVPEYKAITDSIKKVDSLTIQNIKIQVRKKDEQIGLLQLSNNEAKHLIVKLDKQNGRLRKHQKIFKLGTIGGVALSILLMIF